MLLLQTTGTSWDLRTVFREPAFRVVAVLLASLAGYSLALYVRWRINCDKSGISSGSGR